jgi:hypothetical protein
LRIVITLMSRPSTLLPSDDRVRNFGNAAAALHVGDELVVAVPAVDLDARLERRSEVGNVGATRRRVSGRARRRLASPRR